MKKVFPKKLHTGDEIRVIAPSRSLGIISKQVRKIANKRFSDLGLNLSFGKNIEEKNIFDSSSIKSRVQDLHKAFSDKNVKAIITVIGGFNCNQLLDYIDWDLIKKNPKVFCGFSDITILNNAIFTKTGLVTYSGPHYSSFGMEKYFDYSLEYFLKCIFEDNTFEVRESKVWTDDAWYANHNKCAPVKNKGWLLVNQGSTKGTILGANLCTFNLLHGTKYFPSLNNSILFIEDDNIAGDLSAVEFDRNLQSVIHQKDFKGVKGIVIGRFQKECKITNDMIIEIIKSKKELNKIPVIANVDFGHTDTRITFPIGGEAQISAGTSKMKIEILKH